MPNKPKRWCAKCRATHEAECPEKPKHNWNNKRLSRTDGRGGRAWRRKRERLFERDNYLCCICLARGVLKPVDLHGPNHGVLDHIVPTTQGGTDDDDNLQTICQACDKEKTQRESVQART